MSTVKNGEVGTLDTMGQIVWHEAEDLQYYSEIHGSAGGTQDRRAYLIACIEGHLNDYLETLDRAIHFLWKARQELDKNALSLLSVNGKIALLRKLIIERSNEIPVSHRLDYLARFEEHFETYTQVDQIRNKVLSRYLVEPSGTWLRELIDADDWIVTAWFGLEESMGCEHKGFVRLINSRRG